MKSLIVLISIIGCFSVSSIAQSNEKPIKHVQHSERSNHQHEVHIMTDLLFKDVDGDTEEQIIANKIQKIEEEKLNPESMFVDADKERQRLQALEQIKKELLED